VNTHPGNSNVPLMVINNEPFFGGDRFDQFVYRLRQNGLTRNRSPRWISSLLVVWKSMNR
jgi:hypothetical protein